MDDGKKNTYAAGLNITERQGQTENYLGHEASSLIGDRLMKEKEVFKILGISDTTGQQWRGQGKGPKFVKIGRMVRYRESDVRSYINNLESFESTSAIDIKKGRP